MQALPALVTVKGADINALVLSPINMTVALSDQDESVSLVAQYTDGIALPYSGVSGIEYTLDNNIADIDEDGVIFPLSEGAAVLSARALDRHGEWIESNQVVLTVSASPLVSITLHSEHTTVPRGVFGTLRALGEYADGRVEDISDQVSWQSNAPSILTVVDGVTYGVAPGQVEVTAYLGGLLSEPMLIEVTNADLVALQAYFVFPTEVDGIVTLPVGGSGQAKAIASFSDGRAYVVTNQVDWHSSERAVVSVDTNGLYYATAKGEVEGYARLTIDGITKESVKRTIHVTDATPVRLDILPSQVSVVEGLNTELHAVATFSDGHIIDVTSAHGLSWISQDNTVVAVAQPASTVQSAVASGINEGQTVVKATWSDLEAQSLVTVKQKALTDIVLKPTAQTLAKGVSSSLSVIGLYSDNTQEDITSSVSYFRSSNTQVAVVTTDGMVSAKSEGVANITAEFDGFESQAQIIVPRATVTSLRIEIPSTYLIVGTEQRAFAIATFDDGSELDVSSAAYWQSDISNVVVDGGFVWAQSSFSHDAMLTVTFGGQSAQQRLTIGDAILQELTITPDAMYMVEGSEQTFTLNATYSDASVVDVSSQAVWVSSDNTIAGFIPNTSRLSSSHAGQIAITARFGGKEVSVPVHIANKVTDVASLRITPATLILAEGGVAPIKVEVDYNTAPGTFYDVTSQVVWQLDVDYAVVSEGMVISRKVTPSPIDIVASYGGKQASAMLRVTDAAIEKLQLTPQNTTLAKGYTQALVANATLTNGLVIEPDAADMTWQVESGEGISINPLTGVVTATESGKTAKVKAMYLGQSAIADITTTDATLDTVFLTDLDDVPLQHYMMIAKGMSVDTKLFGKLSDGNEVNLNPSKVTYTITGDSVTEKDGVLTAKEGGLSEITASYTDDNETFTSQVVTIAVSSAEVKTLSITTGDVTLVEGMSKKLQAQTILTDGTIVDITQNVIWEAQDPFIASFDGETLTALSKGQTRISASFAGEQAMANLTVTESQLSYISVSPQDAVLAAGQTQDFVATAHFNNDTTYELSSEVSWSVDNSNATIDQDGELMAHSAGTVTVIATLDSSPSQQAKAQVVIVNRNIQLMEVSLGKSHIAKGESNTATAKVTYDDGDEEDITDQVAWSSSDPDVALVTNGYIRGLKSGSTEIKATFRGLSDTQTLTVSDATVSSIQLTPATVTLAKGEKQTLTLMATYSDNSTAVIGNAGATWAIEGAAEGILVNVGIVTAMEADKYATVKAIYQGQSATAAISTTGASIDHIVLLNADTNKQLSSLVLPIGGEQKLKVVAYLSDGNYQTLTSGVHFQSTDNSVVRVSDDGTITTALEGGSATIDAIFTEGEKHFKSSGMTVYVTGKYVTEIAFTETIDSLHKGEEGKFILEATYSDNTTADITNNAVWDSSEKDRATVLRGIVTASQSNVGDSTIIASFEGHKATHTVTITDARLIDVTIAPSSVQVHQGQTAQLTLTANYSDGKDVVNNTLAEWTSSNPQHATVSDGGVVTGVSEGEAIVTAKMPNGASATATVFVIERELKSLGIKLYDDAGRDVDSVNKGNSVRVAVEAYYEGELLPIDVTALASIQTDVEVAYVTYPVGPDSSKSGAASLYGYEPGNTSVTANYQGKEAPFANFRVTDKSLEVLQLSPASQTLPKGVVSLPLELTATYSDKSTEVISNDLATWDVSGEGGVTVEAGVVTAVEAGKIATIDVTYKNKHAQAEVTTTDAELKSIVLTDVSSGLPLMPITLHDGSLPYYLEVRGIYSDGDVISLPMLKDDYVVSGDAVRVENYGGLGMVVNSARGPDSDSAEVYAMHDGLRTASVPVRVESAIAASLEIRPSFVVGEDLMGNSSYQLKAISVLSDGTLLDVTSIVNWSSDTSDVATFSLLSKGLLETKGKGGDATITANYNLSPPHTAYLDVTVSSDSLRRIEVAPGDSTLHEGDSQYYKATGYYSDGLGGGETALDLTKQVSWSSSTPSVATISNDGAVAAVGEGDTMIHASKDGMGVNVKLTVLKEAQVTGLRIDTVQATSLSVGGHAQLDAQIQYEDHKLDDYDAQARVNWIVEDPSVGYILDGVWYAIAVGNTKVYATYRGVVSNYEFVVVHP